MSDNTIQSSFAAGELSPDLYARVDLAKYHTGAALMRNFFVNYKGGCSTRPGTQFIADGGQQTVRLRRFIFSSTQTYILVFTQNSIQFIKNSGGGYPNSSGSGWILSGGVPYVVPTPYNSADLFTLKFSQSADIMQITHPNYPRMVLSRFSDTNWTLTTAVTGSGINPPLITFIAITPPPTGSLDPLQTTYLYTVTAVDSTGAESNATSFKYVTGLDMSSTLGSVTLGWTENNLNLNPIQYYKLYKTVPTSGNVIPPFSQQFGYIGYTYGTTFVDSNIIPDFTQGPPMHKDPFSPQQIVTYTITNAGSGYPVEGTTIQQVSNAAIYSLFNGANAPGSSAPISALFISNAGENIPDGTVIGASGAGGSGFSAVLHTGPSNQNPAVTAYFQQRLMLASTPNNPVTIWGSKSGYYNNFDSSNPILDSDSLTFTLAVQEVNAIEWLLSMPGGLVMFTDSGIQQLSGGSTTAINPLAVTPQTAVAASISNFGANGTCEPIRIVNEILYVQSEGTIVRDLTYNPFFGIIYSGADLTLLSSHLFYPHTIIDWAYQDVPFKTLWAVREDGVLLSMCYLKEQDITGWAHHDTLGGTFESVAVIREGAADAVYFVVNRNGHRYIERLADRIYGNVSQAWCLDAALGYSGGPTSILSGLGHLEGQSVMVLANGMPAGPYTVTGGSITIPANLLTLPSNLALVGLPFQCQLQTLYLDVGGEGRIQGKRKKIAAMSTRVKDTAGLKMGTTFNTVAPYVPGISSTDPVVALPPAPPGLTVGDMRMLMDPAYQVVGCVCIQQDLPLPATVLAVTPEVVLGDS